MLSKKMLEMLNAQIGLEFYSSNVYLQMSAWADDRGLDGCAAFLGRHAAEEMQHMKKMFDYVLERGAMPVLGAIEAPPTDYKDTVSLFRSVYEHEVHVTKSINNIVDAAQQEKDFQTFNFLQWFVAEQVEEEDLTKKALDKAEMIGGDGRGLFLLDREIAKLGVAPGQA